MASSSSQVDWEGDDWERPYQQRQHGAEAEGDEADVSPAEAGEMLVRFLLDLLYSNSLSARSLCVICWWAHKAGAQGIVSDYMVRPDAQSGKFHAKVDSADGTDLRQASQNMYRARVPQTAKHDMIRTVHEMIVQLPHEELAHEAAANPQAATGPSDPEWTEAYHSHPVVRAHPGQVVMPYALYLDGISFTRTDSLLGVFVYSMYTLKRHLCAVLRRSSMCKCGCKGWCTLYEVFRVIRWSMGCLARGEWPSARHDGPFGEHDQQRREKAGQSLGFFGALLHLKGDWSEFAHTLGFADWSSRLYGCIFCSATRENRFEVTGFTPFTSPWTKLRHEDMEIACGQCELWRTLSRKQHAEVRAALRNDKSRDGGAGRCLIVDLPDLHLLRKDRLEPHEGLPDVAAFDAISTFPCRVLFWRRSNETRCRHRNPLFDRAIGVTIDSLAVDKLHSLYLGPAQVWSCHALWKLLVSDVFETGLRGEPLYKESLQRILAQLWPWYKRRRAERPNEELCEIQALTVKMLGNKPTTPQLNLKAKETKDFFPFVLEVLKTMQRRVLDEKKEFLIAAGEALARYLDLLKAAPRNVTDEQLQGMYDCVKRHVLLSQRAGVPLKPKHHMILHLVERTARGGNPNFYATFSDEGINRVLKKVGQAAHRSVWEMRVFSHFGKAEAGRVARKRALDD